MTGKSLYIHIFLHKFHLNQGKASFKIHILKNYVEQTRKQLAHVKSN